MHVWNDKTFSFKGGNFHSAIQYNKFIVLLKIRWHVNYYCLQPFQMTPPNLMLDVVPMFMSLTCLFIVVRLLPGVNFSR